MTAIAASALQLQGIHKAFGSFIALQSVDLTIERGELVCFVGPSGCGKTTLLRIIAGLESQTRGRVIQDGRDVSSAPPAARDYGIVFQSYALFPNLTIRDNVAYGLVNRRRGRAEVESRVAELLKLVGLPGSGAKYPAQMSGGQQQRIALARSLLLNPKFIIADEPTGNLDLKAGETLMALLRDISHQFSITIMMVTHNIDQYKFGSRIVNMVDGRITSDIINQHSIDALEDEDEEEQEPKTEEKAEEPVPAAA